MKEINRFVQEPINGEECPKYEYRQYDTRFGLITVAVNLCEVDKSDVESRFAEQFEEIIARLEREEEKETIALINEDGEEIEL